MCRAFAPFVCLFATACVLGSSFGGGFSLFKPDAGEQPLYQWVGGSAAAGEIAVLPSGSYSAQALYSQTAFDLSEGAVSASFFFLAQSGGGDDSARIALGLDYEQRGLRGADFGLKAIWTYANSTSAGGLRLGGKGQSLAASLIDGHWHSLSVTWRLSTDGTGVLLEASLLDHGLDGNVPAVVLAGGSAQLTDAALFDSSGRVKPLYIGIYAQNSGTDGTSLLKGISMPATSEVPEPALTLWLLCTAALAAAGVKTLRRSSSGSAR